MTGPTRRSVLKLAGSLAAAGALAGSASASSAQSSPRITLDNGTYSVDLHPLNSGGNWEYDGESTFYEEFFAVQNGTGTVATSPGGSVESGFPDDGQPGEPYSATASLRADEVAVDVERTVTLHENDPLFTLQYRITNVGDEPLDPLRLFQYVDYDVLGSTNDAGSIDPDAGHVVQTDQGDSPAAGFVGGAPPDNWEASEWLTASSNVEAGELTGQEEHQGDVTTALVWELGTVPPEGEATFSVAFAAAATEDELLGYLTNVDLASGQTFGAGPAAAFEYSPSSPVAGQDVEFDASPTEAAEAEIVGYEWTVDGESIGTGEVITHSFAETGTYEVGLTVTDAEDETGETSQTVTVDEPVEPVAEFEQFPRSPVAGDEVEFDASESVAESGEIVGYEWTVDGESIGTGEVITHTFAEAGVYEVGLTVTDSNDVSGETSENIRVGEPEDGDDDGGIVGGGDDGSSGDEESGNLADSVPGFGLGSALAGLGGAGYALRRRLGDDEE